MRVIFFLIVFVFFQANAQDDIIGAINTKKNTSVFGGGGGPVPPAASDCQSCPNSAVISNGDEYTPTSVADLTNPSNAGRTAIISNSFSVAGATFAANQILVPNGGRLSGTGINLNGAEIVINHNRIFDDNARLTESYGGCLTPENFGANTFSDDAAIFEAVIENTGYLYMQPSGSYTVNTPKSYQANTGDLDRDFSYFIGNGATVSSSYEDLAGTGGTVISSNFPNQNEDYLFEFDGVKTSLCDFTIDGNDLLHFGIKTNANIYASQVDFLNFGNDDPSERILMVNVWIYSNQMNQVEFQSCEFRGATPTDDGFITNSGGLTRGIIFNYFEVNQARTYLVNDCDFFGFYGEGEGIHTFPPTNIGGISNQDWDHQVVVSVTNSRFGDNSRRDIKSQTSGLSVENCVFTKIDPSSPWASNTTASISFSLADNQTPGLYATNLTIKNSTFNPFNFSTAPNSSFIGITGTRDAVIEGNTFSQPFISTQPAITLSGETVGVDILNNTFNDCGVTSVTMTSLSSGNKVRNNIFNIDVDRNNAFAALGDPPGAVGAMYNVSFQNNDITLDFNTNNNEAHVFGTPRNSIWGNRVYEGVVLDGNNVTYTGPNAANKKFLFVQGDFGASNFVINHNPANGVTASGAFEVLGIQTFTATGNFNGAGDALTKL